MARSRSTALALARLLALSSGPIYVLDEQRRIVYCNPACATWTGVDLEQLVQQRCDYHSSVQATGAAAIAAALCPPPEVFLGQRQGGTIICRRPNGEVVRRRAEFLPLGGDALETVGVLVVVDPEELTTEHQATTASPTEPPTLHQQLTLLRHRLAERYQIDQLIGESLAMRRVRHQLEVAVKAQANVVIVGPAGSGRERVANTIYYSDHWTALGHLVPLSCSLLDAELLQSTITEFVRRCEDLQDARTSALVLLDVDRLAADAQSELAGFLCLPEFHIRLIATARQPLLELARKDLFRYDLAFLLSTIVVELPGLADRAQDIPLLAQRFLEECNAEGGRQFSGFTAEALDLFMQHQWPENVEELAQVVRQACGRAEGPLVGLADLPRPVQLATDPAAAPRQPDETIVLDDFLAEIEKELLERALRRAKGNKAKAARLLGVTRARLHRRLNQLGLE